MLFLAFAICVLSGCTAAAQKPQRSADLFFSYTLQSNARTSAGVFDSGGALIRTLWSNRAEVAGTHSGVWDGRDDSGAEASRNSIWTVKVLKSNVSYRWDGVIGNTEAAWTTSTNIWDGLAYIPTQLRLAFGSNGIWAATGYSEGTVNLLRLNPSAPNRPTAPNKNYASQNVEFVDIDSDGSFLYLANAAVWGGENFVTKLDSITGAPVAFSGGSTISFPYSWKGLNLSGIDVSAKGAPSPNAIAVQDSGRILAVAHPSINSVKFFDKVSGMEYGNALTIVQPLSMGFTSAGLWVLSGSKVYRVSDPGTRNKLTTPLADLSNPVYVATNKANNHIFVLDGGSSQQVKEFDAAFQLVRTYGEEGGYTDGNPSITKTRLMLDNTATKGSTSTNGSWLRVSPNNELWICDGGNAGRILHVSATNSYIDQILFSQETYTVGVSQTVPTRLFRGTIEYEIDYNKPLQPGDPDPALGGDGSWKMVRNWAVGAEGARGSSPANYSAFSVETGILYAEKLSNGRTYGHVLDAKGDTVSEVEFPDSGMTPMRFTGWKSIFDVTPLQVDGSLLKMTTTGTTPNRVITIQRAPLIGFDTSNNPLRGAYITVAAAKYNSTNEPENGNGWGMSSLGQPTSAGVYPIYSTQPFDSSVTTVKPHLAGVIAGRSSYLFRTNREGCIRFPDSAGTWPCTKSYGGHDGVGTEAIGNNIFTTYDGQYATYGGQTYHYWTDGLMIGQFGQNIFYIAGAPKPPGAAGNIAMTRFVSVNGDIYMYMTAEAGYTPVQRWRISNLRSIAESIGNGELGTSIKLVERANSN